MAKYLIEDDTSAAPVQSSGKFVISDEEEPGIIDRAKNIVGSMFSPEAVPSAGSVVSALQGPTMGFLDELAGAGGAAVGALANLTPLGDGKSIPENYRETRDTVRQMSDQYIKDNPVSGHAERIVASLPALAKIPFQAVAEGALPRLYAASKAGAGFGAVSGAGESESDSVRGDVGNAAKSATIGAIAGPVLGEVVNAAAPLVSRMGQKAADMFGFGDGQGGQPAKDWALRKIADAMAKDQQGIENPIAKAAPRMAALGEDATIADSAGQNTRQLLDTLATLPGQAKNKAENLIRSRQAARSGRLFDAAEEGLSPTGARLNETLDALDAARKEASGPLYEQVNSAQVTSTPELDAILERASGAFGRAKEIAKVGGTKFELAPPAAAEEVKAPDLGQLLGQKTAAAAPTAPRVVPLQQMDTLKRALYDAEQGHINPETGRLNEVGRQYKILRRELMEALDNATVDPKTGQSFYKAARDAYAGPTELRNAARLGNDSIRNDAWKVKETMDGMSASELEAFKIGAFEALRKKAGTEAGATSILKMWKEPATSEKLKELFGNESAFRLFSAKVAAQERLKRLDFVGRGSNTGAREAGMGDMDAGMVREAGYLARGATGGNISNAISAAANLYSRIKTPENVRNHMADILLSKGDEASGNINSLLTIRDKIARDKAAKARRAAALVGSM